MSDTKLTDRQAFEQLVRSGNRTNRINWTLSGDQSDVEDLNAAIRRAAGRGEQESGEEPQSQPWKSLSTLENES